MAINLAPNRIAALLAEPPQPTLPIQQSSPTQPFVWGEGGKRMTPQDIEIARNLADEHTRTGLDFSPVQHWTQGLARLANAWIGHDERKRLDAASRASLAAEQQILQGFASGTGGGGTDPAMLTAIANPFISDRTRDALKLQWQATHKTPPAPHYWETNNGSLGVVGSDGKPKVLYADPDPRMNFIPDGEGGGSWVAVPSQAAGTLPPAVPTRPVGKLTPIAGGAPSQGGATFP